MDTISDLLIGFLQKRYQIKSIVKHLKIKKKKSSVWSCVLICDKETWALEKWWNIRLWLWQIRILVRHIDLFIFLQINRIQAWVISQYLWVYIKFSTIRFFMQILWKTGIYAVLKKVTVCVDDHNDASDIECYSDNEFDL